jgi:hypothetical protein
LIVIAAELATAACDLEIETRSGPLPVERGLQDVRTPLIIAVRQLLSAVAADSGLDFDYEHPS